MLKPKTLSLILVVVALGVGVVIISLLPERSPRISVIFGGYTNDPVDPSGRLLFAIFRITNGTRAVLAFKEGPVEVKSPAGWIRNNELHRYYHTPNLEPGKGAQITVFAPSTNMDWRASFEFQEMLIPSYWRYRITSLLHLPNSAFQRKAKSWTLWTSDIDAPFRSSTRRSQSY